MFNSFLEKEDKAHIKNISKSLLLISLVNITIFSLALCFYGNIDIYLLKTHIRCHSLSGPGWISFLLVFASILISWEYFTKIAHRMNMSSLELSERKKILLAISFCIVGVLVFSTMSLLRHFQLQSNAYDLGIHSSIQRNILSGHGFFDPVHNYNYLGDHFSPIIFITSPLMLLWENSAVLLIFQAFLLGISAFAVFKISIKELKSPIFSFLFLVLFLFFPYVNRINAFDYHPVSISIPLVLWALYFLEEKKNHIFLFLICLSFLVKESLPLSAFGLSIYLILDKNNRKLGIKLMFASLSYFILVNSVLIPYFQSPEVKNRMLGYYWKTRYGTLGTSLEDMVMQIRHTPLVWLRKNLLIPSKIASLLRVLSFTGFITLFSKKRLIPLIIPMGWCLMSGYKHQWAFDSHYSAEFIPYFFYASIFGLKNFFRFLSNIPSISVFSQEAWVSVFMFLLILASWVSLPKYFTVTGFAKTKNIYKLANKIPKKNLVITQNSIHPHLSLESVSIFMTEKLIKYSGFYKNNSARAMFENAQYILVDTTLGYWPFSDIASFKKTVKDIIISENFGLVDREGTAFLFKKGYTVKRNSEFFGFTE